MTLDSRTRFRRPIDARAAVGTISLATLLLVAVGHVSAATVSVAAVNFRFDPENRTVNEGDVVRWTFAGDPHTVTSGAPGAPDGRFDSGVKDPGGSFQVTFNTAGTFPYFCQIHPEQMFGTIVVRAGPEPTAAATPTPRPTAKPTAAPTARPTARPTATLTARPTAAPTATPTEAPTASPTAAATASAVPSSAPASGSPSPAVPSAAPSATASANPPSASPPPVPTDAAAGLDPVPIIAVGLVVGLLVAGGVAILRRSPRA